MRGVIWDGKKLHVDQLEVRDPGPGEVRVRVTASGICHSDLIPVDHGSDRLPMVLGHEAAGVIDCLGPDVDGWSVGQHVTVGCQTPCYHCGDCERENYSACPEAWTAARAPFTWRGKPVYSCANSSSFAQQIVVKVSQLYDTSGIPDVEAALIGCAISTGVGAARNLGKIRRGENVVVIGLGGIGVNAIQGARLGGAARILAVDIEATKLATAELYGATDLVTVEPSDRADEVARKILAVTPRVDVVIECSGARTAMEAATQLPYIGGRSVFIGLPPAGQPDSLLGEQLYLGSDVHFGIEWRDDAGCELSASGGRGSGGSDQGASPDHSRMAARRS
jgi:S-(hydroxymethyl)glutathione dehydrogenase/alcohol dehydrogenase